MNRSLAMSVILLIPVFACGCRRSSVPEPTAARLEKLARCLAEKGWVVYGTSTCSGCRAQRKAFGEAWKHITFVECDPHEPGSQVDRCLKLKIRKTPTWIRQVDATETQRLEMYQTLEDLARVSGCTY